jgi:hypothetical protein
MLPVKHSWLREAVDRVLAEAPHMSDAHRRKLVEVVGLELARASARGAEKMARWASVELVMHPLGFPVGVQEESPKECKQVAATCPRCRCEHNIGVDISEELEKERARVRFELRRSVQPNRGTNGRD